MEHIAPQPDLHRFIVLELDHNIGQRIDNLIFKTYPLLPRTLVYNLLRRGLIKINFKKVAHNYHIKFGDKLYLKRELAVQGTKTKINVEQLPALDLKALILYEDANLLIINKPNNLAVHCGTKNRYGLIDYFQDMHLAHRLDKGASGCLMLVKNLETLRAINELNFHQKITKIYLAVISGKFPENQICKIDEKVNGKDAVSYIKTILNHVAGWSLVMIKIVTGRKHQIRQHLAHLGYPIIGDQKFSGLQGTRLFLHASKIIIDGLNQERIEVQAPMESSFEHSFDLKDANFHLRTDDFS